jgi:3-isopropylmalate dehydratase small subunit
MRIDGRLIVLGDNVNTDLIHPPAFYSTDPAVAVRGAFGGLPVDLSTLGPPPYILVGGRNFGCGSSRESTMRALATLGVRAIVARSFAHIFFRTAVAVGIWPLVIADAEAACSTGDEAAVVGPPWDLLCPRGARLCLRPPEPYESMVLDAGGLERFLEQAGWKWDKETA